MSSEIAKARSDAYLEAARMIDKCRATYGASVVDVEMKLRQMSRDALLSAEPSGRKFIQACERIEDMSPDGRLKVFREDDGDIIISIIPPMGKARNCAWGLGDIQVQFCSVGSGGGRSPRTREALLALMEAIEADNKEDKP